eukprot:8166283-Pyramimonas_sp.AAC.1
MIPAVRSKLRSCARGTVYQLCHTLLPLWLLGAYHADHASDGGHRLLILQASHAHDAQEDACAIRE